MMVCDRMVVGCQGVGGYLWVFVSGLSVVEVIVVLMYGSADVEN